MLPLPAMPWEASNKYNQKNAIKRVVGCARMLSTQSARASVCAAGHMATRHIVPPATCPRFTALPPRPFQHKQVEKAPVVVKAGLSKADADAMQKQLEGGEWEP